MPTLQVDEIALAIPRAWYLRYALINLVLWLLLFGLLLLVAMYMQAPISAFDQ
jgi:hypothetical protein